MQAEHVLIESTFNRPNRMKEIFKSVAKRADSKMRKLGRRKPRRTDSKRLLMENNNNDRHDGFNGCDNPMTQNNFNTHVEQRLPTVEEIKYEELAELLQVSPDVSEDGSCSMSSVHLIQRSVSQHFPEPPTDLDQNLQQHLFKVQEAVCNELVRLGPLFETMGLMDCLFDCYHRHTFHHLNDLLQKVHSSQNCLVLMKWVLQTYPSAELLGHPDLQRTDPIKKVDSLLNQEWLQKARDKLLDNVEKEVRALLEKILQIEKKNQEDFDCEEAFVGFYVDTIQCIEAVPKEAQKISRKLSLDVRAVCFRELLTFLERYSTEQAEILGKKAKLDKPEMIPFFKTLTACSKIKLHVQTTAKDVKGCHIEEIMETLDNMEDLTLTLLKQIVTDMAKRNLERYFKTENKHFFVFIVLIETYFSKDFCQDVKKRVMNEVYKLISHIYLKHLVRRSHSKLTKRWSPDVGQAVTEDAELLHNTISNLAPGVQQWNLMLLKIKELLDCQSIVAVQLTVASMQKECPTWREDQDLLPTLLRWKGLSGRRVKEVMNILPGQQPRSRPVSCFSWIFCWVSRESTITSREEDTSDC
ncbi:exocyst complex component 3 [Larimichthys crocea]|uniref:exocyst complex component 3 n=1 Tax=Larimichthys crocea TaxID=215358 RepID=UPI000F5E2CDE|nr:exocyst complex component 3-like [Larimichthys crocea]